MYWSEACAKSEIKEAWRRSKDGKWIIINEDGLAKVRIRSGQFRDALPEEFQGLLDWNPSHVIRLAGNNVEIPKDGIK